MKKRPKPDWQTEDGGVQLYCSDCRRILPILESESVDAVVTDPPYGVGVADWDKATPHEALLDVLRIASGTVLWFGAASQMIVDVKVFPVEPDRVMIWVPRFTLAKVAKDGYAYRFHPIYLWRVRKQKEQPWDVFDDNCDGHNWWFHPGTKPVSLLLRLVVAVSSVGNVVFDPFMGSGTTGVACIRTGRKFIGIELDEKYFAIAVKRIEDALEQEKMNLFHDASCKMGKGDCRFF